MIKVLEKDFLDDEFINKQFISNISLNEKLTFNKNDIYYFGNYDDDYINFIKDKLYHNKKSMLNAIERNVKFIVCGSSCEIFNNHFKCNDINLFTLYNPSMFKYRFKKLKIRKEKNNINIKYVNSLDKVVNASCFRYKNLFCISSEKNIDKIIKKQSKTTLLFQW